MKLEPPTDSTFATFAEPEVCGQCQSVSRLTNGLCLNCLLRGALGEEDQPSGKEDFKEVLAGIKSGDGDWRIADHEILDEIARGGMGVVYQAREPHSGRIVALKCVLAYQSESDHVVARFRREAETAAALEHSNIVPIYQVGETANGFPYYTMKYAAAGSLLQARGPLLQHPRHSATLIAKVARAVQYAHEKGVLHRDLKPGNILLDSQGEPLVSDFGLARCETGSSFLTRSLSSFGTPGYMAPEQADGPAAKLTAAADIYSLGAILFELITGRTPFVGENAFAVLKQSAEEGAPSLRSVAPNADVDLEIICARCLEREPADRYQTAAELADDLENWLNDRPIVASSPSLSRRAQRWIRRNRKLAVSLAGLAIVGAGSLLWQIRAERIQSTMRENFLAARSVVVFPFLNLETLSADAGAARAVANGLTAQFESFGPARVSTGALPGWSKLEDLRQAAREAKSRAAITGTVRNVAGKQRVSLRLLDPASGETLFAKVLDENEATPGSPEKTGQWPADVYKIITADNWSDVLNSRKDPGLRNEAAAEAIKSGRAWMTGSTLADVDRAIALFNKAVAIEPNSAVANACLAMAATGRLHWVADPKYMELGKSAALKAFSLEPDSVEAHRALGGVYYQEGKFSDALEESLRTVETGGVSERIAIFLGMTLDILGRPDQALGWYRIVSTVQSRPAEADSLVGDCWAKLGDDESAVRAYDRAIEMYPGSSEGAVGKCRVYMLRGEFEAAREIYRKDFRELNALGGMAEVAAQVEFFARNYGAAEELYVNLAKRDAHGGGAFYGAISYQSALGRIKQARGSGPDANELLRESLENERTAFASQPQNSEAAYRLAAAEASFGLPEASLQHLREAVALGWLDHRSLEKDPRFDSLRAKPELNAIITNLNAKVADLRTKASAR